MSTPFSSTVSSRPVLGRMIHGEVTQSYAPPEPADPRPHVAALLELETLGWRLIELRPGREAPVLWRVTVQRFDGDVSITVTEADPDEALYELLRYASVDAEDTPVATPSNDDDDPVIDPPVPEGPYSAEERAEAQP